MLSLKVRRGGTDIKCEHRRLINRRKQLNNLSKVVPNSEVIPIKN